MKLAGSIVWLCVGVFSLSQAPAAEITLFTGARTGTYYQFGTAIADMAGKAGTAVVVRESQGSIDNIKQLEQTRAPALGIVQSDVLDFLGYSTDPKLRRLAHKVRLVIPLYDEEVHLFANTGIKTFADLQGKRLVVGEQGSGNWLTATNLLQMTGVKPARLLAMSPLKAVIAVFQGEADAMIYVAGKPVPLFTKMGELRQQPQYAPLFKKVHLVPLDNIILLREYQAGTIGPADYPWLTAKVPTITVRSVLMDLAADGGKAAAERCQAVGNLVQLIRRNLGDLKRRHPKWREVNLNARVGAWKPDPCVRQALAR